MSDPQPFIHVMQDVMDHMDAESSPKRFPVVRTRHTAERPRFDNATRRFVHARDHWRCQWCQRHWTEVALEIDHIIPWSAGGGNHVGNLRTLCRDCNSQRSNFDVDTVQRAFPVAASCLECDDSLYVECAELVKVFCANCRTNGVGGF